MQWVNSYRFGAATWVQWLTEDKFYPVGLFGGVIMMLGKLKSKETEGAS